MPNHSRARSGRDLKRRPPQRGPFPRILIYCEGEKTERNYFEEIRILARLPSSRLLVRPHRSGTEPRQIVDDAEAEFLKGRAFEKIYAVFDRDQHRTYGDAIARAEALNGKYKNDERVAVSFEAIVSVPCFELWLLLHFIDVTAPMLPAEALVRLTHRLPTYDKGNADSYAATKERLPAASRRARALKAENSRLPGTEAYTDVHELVEVLLRLRQGQTTG